MAVLVTGKARNAGQMAGRTPYLQATHFECDEDLTGQIVNVTMDAASMNSVGGKRADLAEPVN